MTSAFKIIAGQLCRGSSLIQRPVHRGCSSIKQYFTVDSDLYLWFTWPSQQPCALREVTSAFCQWGNWVSAKGTCPRGRLAVRSQERHPGPTQTTVSWAFSCLVFVAVGGGRGGGERKIVAESRFQVQILVLPINDLCGLSWARCLISAFPHL